MIPVIPYPSNLQLDYIVLSTDDKPEKNVPYLSALFERDTEQLYVWDGTQWVKHGKGLIARLHTYNEETGEWESVKTYETLLRSELILIRRVLEEILVSIKEVNR